MKLGTEHRTKTILALVVAAVAVFQLVRTFSNSGSTSANVAAPAEAGNSSGRGPAQPQSQGPARTAPRRNSGNRVLTAQNSLDPRLQLAMLKDSEGVNYNGTGRNIFREEEPPAPK